MSKSAIDAQRGNIFRCDPESLVIVGLDTEAKDSDPCLDKPRLKLLDREDAAMRALIEDIKLNGVQQPVLVTKDGDDLKVIAGRRRVFAARFAAKESGQEILVPAMSPVKGTEAQLFRRLITENELRVDDLPSMKAQKCLKMMGYLAGGAEPTKEHFEELTVIFGGVSISTIKNYLAFGGLASKVQKMADNGDIGIAAVIQLAALPRDEQEAAALKLIAEGKTTAEHARAERNKRKGKGKQDPRPGLKLLRDMARLLLDDKKEGRKVYVSDDVLDVFRAIQGEVSWQKIKGCSELVTRAESGLE